MAGTVERGVGQSDVRTQVEEAEDGPFLLVVGERVKRP
jgi:hypothetical protein